MGLLQRGGGKCCECCFVNLPGPRHHTEPCFWFLADDMAAAGGRDNTTSPALQAVCG